LRQVDGVRQVIRVGGTHIRLVVDEASLVIPRILNWTKGRDVDIQSVKEYQPPFDDVFVRLIEKQEDGPKSEEEESDE
jgi:hypothetical protein